jgi:LemA protein
MMRWSLSQARVAVVGLCLALVLSSCGVNDVPRLDEQVKAAWSEVLNQYQRRTDLIPNLVETVKGYATHEQSTFEAVTAARAGAVSAGATGDPAKIGPAENALSGTLRSLFAVAENYPQLRAVESFVQLQEQLTATEDKLEFARRYYNTSSRDYNVAIQTFPRSVLAGTFGFHPVNFFEVGEADRDVPSVSFAPPPAAAVPPTPPAG